MIQEEFLSRLELSKYIIADMTPAEKINMLDKYDKLANSVINKLPGTTFNNDIANYSTLLNDQVFTLFMKNTTFLDLHEYPNLYKMYSVCRQSVSKQLEKQGSAANTSVVKDRTYGSLLREFRRKLEEAGATIPASLDADTVRVALQTFGVKTTTDENAVATPEDVADTTPDTEIDKIKDTLFDDDLEDQFNQMYGDEDEDGEDEDEGEPERYDEDENGNNFEFEFDDDEQTGEPVKGEADEDEDEPKMDTELTEEEKEKLEKEKADLEYFEAFKQIYEGAEDGSSTPLRSAIDGVMLSLNDLYMSCFSGITAPDGILTDKGLLSLDRVDGKYKFVYNHTDIDLKSTPVTSPKYIKYKTNSSEYNKRYKAVMYALGVALGGCSEISVQSMDQAQVTQCIETAVRTAESIFGTAIDGRKGALPKYADANAVNYYPRLHTEFMTGNFNVCKEMHDWAEKNKVHRNAYKITNFGDLMKWARIRVSDCFTQALIDAQLRIEDAGNNDAQVTSICQVMAKKIKNIIVITNTKKSHFTLKICTSQVVNGKIIEKCIMDYFNASSAGSKSTSVIIKNGGSESGVTELDVILNMADYDASSRMSAEVIDDILETGNVPSWSNAILGEKNNGGAFNYNFKNKYALSIYGSSGSGKGIMTSALLTNAMAEGCAILYIDGKPDNGAALGKIAWDKGLEAPVFNACTGRTAGGSCKTFPAFLEDYSHGIRDKKIRDEQIAKIPLLPNVDSELWPFSAAHPQNRGMLYEVSLTLKSFELAQDIIIQRSMGGDALEKLPNGDTRWAVIIIDEIENAANNEDIIRKAIKTYMDRVGDRDVFKTEVNSKGEQVEKKDGKIRDCKNWSKDEGYLFCRQWLDWADNICSNWASLVTISLRNSCTTLITIFQANRWFNQAGNVTTGSTKIGKLMLALGAKVIKIVGKSALVSSNTWGDATSYKWSPEVDKGKWVVASNEGTLDDDDTVFKPFKVFTTDLGDGIEVPFDDYGAGASNCWQTREDKYDKSKKKPLGLQSYVNYLFNGLQNEMQTQLQNGERLEGTLTPEGVLKTSFDYYNRMRGGNLLGDLYTVAPIVNFTGSIDEAEAQQINQRQEEQEQGQAQLDNLNNNLGNYGAGNGEVIDFGSDEPIKPAGPSPIPGQRVNSTGQATPPTPYENALDQARSDEEQIKQLTKLTSTKKLRLANYSDNVLSAYYTQVLDKRHILSNNTFNYSNRAREYGGLYCAAISLGNICYMHKERNMFDIDTFRSQAMAQIKSLNDPQDKWKFLIGILDDYLNDYLEYDEMPSEDRMREYQIKYGANVAPESGYGYPDTDGYEDLNPNDLMDGDDYSDDEYGYDQSYMNSPEDEMWDGHQEFINNGQGRNRVITVNPSPTSDVVRLNYDDYIEQSAPRWHTMERFRKKLFESANGTAYEFKKRWDYVLKKIAERHADRALVRKMAFTELHVIVNGKMMALNNLIGGDDDIQITDILRIRDTFKKFPFIQSITFDGPTTQCLIDEYGTTAQEVWNIFRENRALKVLELTTPSGQMTLRRETFQSMADKFDQAMGIRVAQMQYEQFGSSYNPRLQEKSPGYTHRILKNTKSKASSWFKNKPKTKVKMDPVVRKRLKYTGVTLGVLALGAVIGVPGLIATGVGSAIAYFKGSR